MSDQEIGNGYNGYNSKANVFIIISEEGYQKLKDIFREYDGDKEQDYLSRGSDRDYPFRIRIYTSLVYTVDCDNRYDKLKKALMSIDPKEYTIWAKDIYDGFIADFAGSYYKSLGNIAYSALSRLMYRTLFSIDSANSKEYFEQLAANILNRFEQVMRHEYAIFGTDNKNSSYYRALCNEYIYLFLDMPTEW